MDANSINNQLRPAQREKATTEINLDNISQQLCDQLSAIHFDVTATAQLLKQCCRLLELKNRDTICIATKHRLCMALANGFFMLLEHGQRKDVNFPEILSYIRISLTCMSLLKQTSVASHILCRALLERTIVYGHLFNANFQLDLVRPEANRSPSWSNGDSIKLSEENLKVTLGHRFRRLPNQYLKKSNTVSRSLPVNGNSHNHNSETVEMEVTDDQPVGATKPDGPSINSYLLVEAFKSSISDIEAFAALFVEFHCQVTFDRNLWPSEDALRVINAKNLSILRKFEQISPFWDLYELIGQSGCLKSCLVLVKALLSAHLALWASATIYSSSDKMISTTRLIPPLAQSGLIPRAFGLAVEVFALLEPGEVFSILSDIWQYLKDTNTNGVFLDTLAEDERRIKDKTYLSRLRIFMCQHLPGPLYVDIFKEYYSPQPKIIPTDKAD